MTNCPRCGSDKLHPQYRGLCEDCWNAARDGSTVYGFSPSDEQFENMAKRRAAKREAKQKGGET